MNKSNFKLFFISILCVLTLSCTFLSQNTGNIAFELPATEDSRAVGDNLSYDVKLTSKNTSKVFYHNEKAPKIITIKDIPVGVYILTVEAEDTQFKYFGECDVEIFAGKETPVELNLEKESKNPPTPEGAKLISFTVTTKSDGYVLYGSDVIDINNFIIIEHYENAPDRQLVENSDYTVTKFAPKPVEIGQNVTVTIVNTKNVGVFSDNSNAITIPCKVKLEAPRSITLPQPKQKPKFTGTYDITVNINIDLSVLDYTNFEYSWECSDNKNGPFRKIEKSTSQTLTLTNPSEKKYYRCVCKTLAKNPEYCINNDAIQPKTTETVCVDPVAWTLALESEDATNLNGSTTYQLVLSNSAYEGQISDISGLTWSSSNNLFAVTATGEVTTPVAVTGALQKSTITVGTNSGVKFNEFASLVVTVPAASGGGETTPETGGGTENAFTKFKNAIETGTEPTVTITEPINVTGPITISRDVTINVTGTGKLIRDASYEGTSVMNDGQFFVIESGNVTFTNVEIDGGYKQGYVGQKSLVKVIGGKVVFDSCKLMNNFINTEGGGAILIDGLTANVEIKGNSEISGNQFTANINGVAIYVKNGTLNIVTCRFKSNKYINKGTRTITINGGATFKNKDKTETPSTLTHFGEKDYL